MATNAEDLFNDVNPFSGNLPAPPPEVPAVLAEVAIQREIAEVQAMMAIAKKFPRDQQKSMDRILKACERVTLADGALYTYARGGTDITGPTIRLAEAIAQNWENLQFGVRELEQRYGESTVEAYAWDMETNTRQTKVFQVRHVRKARGATLEDPRDVYEIVANQGARRMRACILGIVPGDVVEAAIAKCEETMKKKAAITPETITRMLEKFGAYKVTKPMIEKRIQRDIEAVTQSQVVSLGKIYNSLKDGMSKPEDWFDMEAVEPEKKKRKKPSPKAKDNSPEAPQETKDPGPGETTSSTNGKPGENIVDRDSAEEIRLYCAKLGLNLEGKVKEYASDGLPDVRVMNKEDAGRLLGWLMDQAADKGLI